MGIAGASGLIYAERAIGYLLAAGCAVDVVASRASYAVYQAERGIQLPADPDRQAEFWRERAGGVASGRLACHRWNDIGAGIASGSYRTRGMVVIPCSMSTVAKLANGLSSDLLERAADVQLKEGRPLVVVPRETPFSLIHLRNLTALAEAGVRVVPAIPAWYHDPQTIDDLVDFVVARALDQIGFEGVPLRRWKEEDSPDRVSSEPISSERNSSDQNSSQQNSSQQVSPEQNFSEPISSDQNSPERNSSEKNSSEKISPDRVSSAQASPEPRSPDDSPGEPLRDRPLEGELRP